MPADPSLMNQNDLLVDSFKPPVSSVMEVAEEVAEGEMTQTTTQMPLLPKPQTENSMERSQQSSQEIKR